MTEPVKITRKDLGIIEGMHVFEIINEDTGQVIGYDQTPAE